VTDPTAMVWEQLGLNPIAGLWAFAMVAGIVALVKLMQPARGKR